LLLSKITTFSTSNDTIDLLDDIIDLFPCVLVSPCTLLGYIDTITPSSFHCRHLQIISTNSTIYKFYISWLKYTKICPTISHDTSVLLATSSLTMSLLNIIITYHSDVVLSLKFHWLLSYPVSHQDITL
jgi:hypothetical protein